MAEYTHSDGAVEVTVDGSVRDLQLAGAPPRLSPKAELQLAARTLGLSDKGTKDELADRIAEAEPATSPTFDDPGEPEPAKVTPGLTHDGNPDEPYVPEG